MSDDDKTQIAPSSTAARVGTQLSGIYELDERLASGGMGEVYRGHNIQTGDAVAIKIVLPEFAQDQTILALFRKEASILNHLAHDAIVRYHVFTIDPGIARPYLAMEFVNGESLFDVLRRGTMATDDVRKLCFRLASGLSAVHEAGAVHRDLSPDNVILPGGRVDRAKIIDFGIARSATVGGETLIGGKFAGKYNYVSPEQLGLYGGDVSEKSDIYSLGLVLAAALRGKPLEMSGSQLEIVEKRRTVPDLTGVDEAFRPILEEMLQPDPKDRPSSAELAAMTRDSATVSAATTRLRTDFPHGRPLQASVPVSQTVPAPVSSPVAASIQAPSTQAAASQAASEASVPETRQSQEPRQQASDAALPAGFVPYKPPVIPTAPLPAVARPANDRLAGSLATPTAPTPATNTRRGVVVGAIAACMVLALGIAYTTGFLSFAPPAGEAPVNQPTDAAPPATAASEPAPVAPAETSAPTTTPPEPSPAPAAPAPSVEAPAPEAAPPAAPIPTAPVEAAPAQAAPVPASATPQQQAMLDWVSDYRGGSCFYAAASVDSALAGTVAVRGFATSPGPFAELARAFELQFKTAPRIDPQVIDPAQCEITAFLRATAMFADRAPRLVLDRKAVPNGAPVSGTVDGRGSAASLFLVDHRGMVFNLKGRLADPAGIGPFSIPIALGSADQAAGLAVPQLMVAVTGIADLVAASFERPLQAKELFPSILAELRARNGEAAASAQLFRLGG